MLSTPIGVVVGWEAHPTAGLIFCFRQPENISLIDLHYSRFTAKTGKAVRRRQYG
ncbi:MAG: hypothetical protein IKI11_10400 [Neisseriaceae bacterium]|nr:hypothetical protein [Neisseriaceae bacterium]